MLLVGDRSFGSVWVMQDPCGNEFCVFGPHLSADFPTGTRVWDEQTGDHA